MNIMKRRNCELDNSNAAKTIPPGTSRRTVTPVGSKELNYVGDHRNVALNAPSGSQEGHPKRLKLSNSQSSSCSFRMGKGSKTFTEQNEFARLDLSNDQHARRVSQRRKMIATGKASLSYSLYRQKVPKDQRRPRSMVTPTTPDHTLDIPNKRWQGMVRAWRRSLHQYDDDDDVNREEAGDKNEEKEATSEPKNVETVQDHELAVAKANGLLVDMSATVGEAGTEASINCGGHMNELDDWDVTRRNNSNGCDLWSDDDSDDDLL